MVIPALLPRGAGHQFVIYADSCSGVPGAPHEATFAAVNAVIRQLHPPPEFICFPGDEIQGLTADDDDLRGQWRHWLDVEMAWLDRAAIPLYHTTGNHTTYDSASEAIFREVLPHLPPNGPPGQEGLAYHVRRGDLLMVFVHTLPSALGGEGRVETEWLDQTLTAHADARHKLVFGHHPVFPVNGFAGPFQRELGPAEGRALWRLLVRHGVLAYVCSHILAFDVQIHEGVVQLVTAGAGTAHRMPEKTEYLHCLQATLDDGGLRYQVLDETGVVRECLSWPLALPRSMEWPLMRSGDWSPPGTPVPTGAHLLAWQFTGIAAADSGSPQTLLSAGNADGALAPLWVGLTGEEGRLTVLLAPRPGRSPHRWLGPTLTAGAPFAIQIAIHTGMGPGGILWRADDAAPWTSLTAASPWGAERLAWPRHWTLGHGQRGAGDQPFRGARLTARHHALLMSDG